MTTTDLLPEIRRQAKDSVAGSPRLTDLQYVGLVSNCLGILFGMRPDAFMVSTIVCESPTVAVASAELGVRPAFKECVVAGTAALALGENLSDKASIAASNALMDRFMQLAGMVV